MSSKIFIPSFSDENKRIQTFFFLHADPKFIRQLARCGFFYDFSNNQSIVTCFNCGSGVEIDTFKNYINLIASIHLKINPNCSYITSLLSDRELKKVRFREQYIAPVMYYKRELALYSEEHFDCYQRLLTLNGVKNKTKVARAGFFLKNKKFYCYTCGCRTTDFVDNDPWREHCVRNPQCKHLLKSKGFYYVQKHL
jgi:Inhibitor of Apoptosis domain